MLTLKNIAQQLGLDVSVVSRALNPNPDKHAVVAADTKKLIVETAKKMGYQRNRQAEFLKRGRVATIGVFIPSQPNRLIADLMIGISLEAATQGFPLNFYFGSNWQDYHRFLRGNDDASLSGIITYPFQKSIADKISRALYEYRDKGGNIVVLNAAQDYDGIPVLRIDDTSGARMAAERLLKCRCTCFLTDDQYPQRNKPFIDYLAGKKKAVVQFRKDSAANDIRESLKKKSSPVGIFASTDSLGMSIYSLAYRAHWKIGEEIRLIGYDDLYLTDQLTPSLTTIHQPFRELGVQSVKTLVRMIYGQPAKNKLIKPTLIIRESTEG